MTGSEWVEGADLENVLPHRGANLLLDAARTVRDGDVVRGESHLAVVSGDASGRDVFLREGAGGKAVMIEPALAEHLALNAIGVMKPGMAPGEIAFFSVISDFESARETRPGEKLTSEVTKKRDKGNFKRFAGVVRGEDGSTVAVAEVMAYTAEPEAARRWETSKVVSPPPMGDVRAIDRAMFGWKRPEMVFIDERVHLSDDLSEATFRYTYPADHVFCAGHFPGNPIMMGIAQWIAVADAAAWLAFERVGAGIVPPPDGRRRADAEIVRETGGLVTEVRGLIFTAEVSADGGIGPVRIERTRRVGFRDLVRPGETVFVRIRLEPDGRG